MKKMMSLLAVLVLVISTNAFAEDKKDSKKKSDKKEAKSSDVTENKKLKAELGSMSKFSMSGTIGYVGALDDVFGDTLPNPNNSRGNYATSVSGSLSARYRLDKTTSITGGISYLYYIPSTYTDAVTGITQDTAHQLKNPSISYNKVIKHDGYLQTKSWTVTKFTQEGTLDAGWSWEVDYSTSFYWSKVKGSNFTLGVSFGAYHDFYNKDIFGKIGSTELAARAQTIGVDDYGIAIYPFAEYALSDSFTLRTVVGQAFTHYVSSNAGTVATPWNSFVRQKLYQTIGLGYAITDLIYMYNYVKWYPVHNIKNDDGNSAFMDTAQWGISVTFNLF